MRILFSSSKTWTAAGGKGDTAVIEYQWSMAWTSAGVDYRDICREVLVLASRGGSWRVVWRTQIPVMT